MARRRLASHDEEGGDETTQDILGTARKAPEDLAESALNGRGKRSRAGGAAAGKSVNLTLRDQEKVCLNILLHCEDVALLSRMLDSWYGARLRTLVVSRRLCEDEPRKTRVIYDDIPRYSRYHLRNVVFPMATVFVAFMFTDFLSGSHSIHCDIRLWH